MFASAWYVVQRFTVPKDDLGRFQGTWKLTPDGRENRFPVTVKVTGDRWAYMVADKEQKRYLLTLRPEANPKEIDLTQLDANDQPSAFVLRGIYVIDGDGVRIVTAPNPLPRPTAFDAPDGPPVWVLERP